MKERGIMGRWGGAGDRSSPSVARATSPAWLALVCALAGACSREPASERAGGETAPPAASAQPAIEPPAPKELPLVRERREIMSTIYEVSVVSADAARAREAIARALDEVARLERVLSEWIPDSEVSRINAAAGRSAVEVGTDTLANVRAALDAAQRTGGAFDITWAALRPFYLFQPGEQRVPDLAKVRANKHLVNHRDVVIDEAAKSVFLKRKGMAIGLGGIAKGWAVDRASAILVEAGFGDHMVFAGGQVLVHGLRNGRKWRIGVQHPRKAGYIGFFEVTDASIATAGDYEHSFVDPEGRRWHHILDPKTGLPSLASSSVTLIARSGLTADALDTGCFVMGPERCLEMLKELPEPAEAVILDQDLRMFTTPGMREKMVMRVTLDDQGRVPL